MVLSPLSRSMADFDSSSTELLGDFCFMLMGGELRACGGSSGEYAMPMAIL